MGRIRTREVKTLSKNLVEKFPEKFDKDFENNKNVLKELNVKSKWMRNRIAGYIVNLKKSGE